MKIGTMLAVGLFFSLAGCGGFNGIVKDEASMMKCWEAFADKQNKRGNRPDYFPNGLTPKMRAEMREVVADFFLL